MRLPFLRHSELASESRAQASATFRHPELVSESTAPRVRQMPKQVRHDEWKSWSASSFAALALLLATPAHADTLVDNVDGITLDADGRVVRFTGLVIDDDGRVARLLQRRDDRPGRPDFRKDGRGAVLMPGLIDAHGHVMGLGFQAMLLDLSATRTLAEAQAAIRAYAAANPDLPWIMGRGWNQEVWGLGRFPTAADLDSLGIDRPIWLERVDGHAGWANSAAMRAAGITAATRAPAGGSRWRAAARPASSSMPPPHSSTRTGRSRSRRTATAR